MHRCDPNLALVVSQNPGMEQEALAIPQKDYQARQTIWVVLEFYFNEHCTKCLFSRTVHDENIACNSLCY